MTGSKNGRLKNAPPPHRPKTVESKKREGAGISIPKGTMAAGAVLVAALAVCAVVFLTGVRRGPDTEVLRPLIEPPVEDSGLTWGAHRAQHYFGLRMRHAASPLFGFMWYEQPAEMSMPAIRHWCNQDDKINSYAWTHADGRTFGRQTINDTFTLLQTDWLNSADSCFAARVASKKHKKSTATRANFYFYMAFEPTAHGSVSLASGKEWAIKGTSKELGDFTLSIESPQRSKTMVTDLILPSTPLENLNEPLMRNMRASDTQYGIIYVLAQKDETKPADGSGTFALLAINAPVDAQFEIKLSRTGAEDPPTGSAFDKELAARVELFEKRFEAAFKISGKGYTPVQEKMARVALSNMLGSIGVWRGSNKVSVGGSRDRTIPYGPHYLLSAVPSRPFFPRGFLWDEGFHQLLISKFDPVLTLECITSWLNIMNVNGWIPREMIFGPEAEAKVPSEYVAQYPDVANPPSFFYLLDTMTRDEELVTRYNATFAAVYQRVAKWYKWLTDSQSGPHSDTFQWRGRNATTKMELNPKTLASGFDDAPRASHPSKQEYHVDLRCWLAVSARVLSRLAAQFGTSDEAEAYRATAASLSDFDALRKRHWTEEGKQFADFGMHSLSVHLAEKFDKDKQGRVLSKWMEREVSDPPRLRHVTDALGYISLFPLITRLIPAMEERYLDAVLDHLTDGDELWTDYGIRSISAQSPYYRARNTEHDPPYWRGSIWMPINYLVLKSLREYAEDEGCPLRERERFAATHAGLKAALIRNLAKEFERTGYLWEHYDDKTGKGHGSHPMTGWTSLILLVMSEPDLKLQ